MVELERNEAFRRLHRHDRVEVELFSIANPDGRPAPLTVSHRHARVPHENKFVLTLTNTL